ncbi:MAG: hypothetical protein Q7U57_09615 [Methylovulum sp.]|nr:hypothetical protein [Methylovulum sp.]
MQVNPRYALTQVIAQHLMAYQHDTGVSMLAFVADVRGHYERTVAPSSRLIEWSTLPDIHRRMERDAGKFQRWLDDDSDARLPADMTESTIAAFPPDRRLMLQIEIADRQGLRVANNPKDAVSDITTLGDLARTHGQAICALADIFEDGRVDVNDRRFAPGALSAIRQSIAVLISMEAIIESKVFGVDHA